MLCLVVLFCCWVVVVCLFVRVSFVAEFWMLQSTVWLHGAGIAAYTACSARAGEVLRPRAAFGFVVFVSRLSW